LLATAAACVGAAVPVSASTGETPANYGTCISQAAMFAEEPVRALTQSYDPIVLNGDGLISPPGGDRVGLACGIEG
jgi:hypothetical protein